MPIVAAAAVPHPPLIIPQVGGGKQAGIAKTAEAYRAAMQFIADAKPETVVVVSPHSDLYYDWFHISPGAGAKGDFARFGAKDVVVEAAYDEALGAAIAEEAAREKVAAGFAGQKSTDLDHGVAIPLYFLRQALPAFKVVRIGLSGFSAAEHYHLGMCIQKASGARRVAVIGSGDLSHKLLAEGPYGFAEEGPRLDKEITAALEKGDFGALMDIDPQLAEKGAECGLRSFAVMAGALDGLAVTPRLLSYEGPFGVGYAVATFAPGAEDAARRFFAIAEANLRGEMQAARAAEDAWVKLARAAIESWVQNGVRPALPDDLPAELLQNQAGVFVSLHMFGELRGCIGTVLPLTDNLAEEILRNAISAAVEDPRFAPVRPDELAALDIHVDVLAPAEEVDSMDALDPAKYGVIVTSGGRRGLLLPGLDGVDTPRQQVDIARQKAGILADVPVKLERFTVERHG